MDNIKYDDTNDPFQIGSRNVLITNNAHSIEKQKLEVLIPILFFILSNIG